MDSKRARYELKPPPRWLHCPRTSLDRINSFVAFKTPLDDRYDECVPVECKFTPKMLLDKMKNLRACDPQTQQLTQVKIGLWIDLTKVEDDRRYSSKTIREAGILHKKIKCEGYQGAPTPEQYRIFRDACDSYLDKNPSGTIAVHCTHGFNRTGFLIVSYLVDVLGYQIEAAIKEFSSKRPPGIYKKEYIDELYRRWGTEDDNIVPAPELPDWCNEEDVDDEVGPPAGVKESQNGSSMPSGELKRKSAVKTKNFHPGVQFVSSVEGSKATEVQNKITEFCSWKKKNTFPGAQPVSMTLENIHLLQDSNYAITWKADGTRYMMLIDGEDVYLADRDFSIFKVSAKFFTPDLKPLKDTLLDGEFVVDRMKRPDGSRIDEFPNFLIYDIISYNKENIGEQFFWERFDCVQKQIMEPRDLAKRKQLIVKGRESFGIRKKEFFALNQKEKVLKGGSYVKNLTHDTDGLIFQPVDEPYTFGQCPALLKWKEPEHNSIDFKLKLATQSGIGLLPTRVGQLYVIENGKEVHYRGFTIGLTKELKSLDGKIIECRVKNGPRGPEWNFMRQRVDKSFPNAYATAESVLNSIMNPVTEEFLLAYIDALPDDLKISGKPMPQFKHPPPPGQDRRK